MRAFIARLRHRDAVLENLNSLLLLYPRKRQFAADFPELKAVMRAHCEAGVAAPSSALQIAVGIIENFLRQLDDRGKAAVLDALVQTGRPGFSEIAAARLKGERGEERDPVRFATRLAGVAIFMAARMAEEGTLSRRDYGGFLEKLASALGADAAREQELSRSFALQEHRPL